MRKATLLSLLFTCGVVAAQDVKILNLKSNDVIYLPSTDRLYVTTSDGVEHGNSLCVVNPIQGKVETCYLIGDSPGMLAASDDEKYIYIGLQTSPQIVRFDVESNTIGLRFPLGSGPYPYGPYFAEDIAVVPGAPHVIAVARMSPSIAPRHAGVAVYENGVMRPETTPVHTGSNSIVFDTNTGFLYGYNNESSEFAIRKMSVNTNGVFVESATPNLLDRFFDEIKYADGKLYSNFGKVISLNDGTPALEGAFNVGSAFPVVEPAADTNVVFFLNAADAAISFQTFDKNSRSYIEQLNFPNIKGNPYKLVQWGEGGKVAFITRDFLSGHHSRLVIMRTCTSTITEPPVVERSGNTCFGDTVFLFAEGPAGEVFWSDGQTGPVAEVDFTGAYFCSIADENGCLSPASSPLLLSFNEYPPIPYIYLSENEQFLYTAFDFGIQWFLNGEPIPGAQSSTLYFTESGIYSAQATWYECSSPFSNEISIVISGTQQPVGKAFSQIFPNPAVDIAYLHLSTSETRIGMIYIRRMDGQLLSSQALRVGQEVQELSLGSLSAGMYVVEVLDENGRRIAVERLAKR